MLSQLGCKLLIVCMLLVAGPSHADDFNDLRLYISNNFANKISLSEEQLQQLSWAIKHKRRTFEMDMYVSPAEINMEITRALARLYCLQLLTTGDKNSYDQFIAAQLALKTPNILSFNSFNKLARHIQQLKPSDHDLLATATILSAVSLSSEAERLAHNVLNREQVANNSLEFLATSLRVDASIYPVAAKIIDDNVDAQKLLYVLFPPQTNFRHMLYTEGGVGMFQYLRTMIKHQYMNKHELNLWYAYWIINIAGFRGHVSHDGSVYLTEPVFQSMAQLKTMIDEMLESPNYDPLMPYLEYRATLLGLNNLPQDERLLLAHFGGLMHLYNVEDGRRLHASFQKLPLGQRQQLAQYLALLLSNPGQLYPTYGPALFGNTLELNNHNIEQTVKIMIPFYCQAIQLYNQARLNSELKPGVSLSFNKSCATENIKRLLNSGVISLDRIKVDSDGEVQI